MNTFQTTLLFLALILRSFGGELYVSREHGFLAQFPAEVEIMRMQNPLGPLTGYVSADEDNALIYQIVIMDVEANKALKNPVEDQIRKLVKSNFDSYCKESEAIAVESKWSEVSAWAMIEFSCTHNGFLGDGIISYKRGYSFLHGSKYYRLTVHGIEQNKALKDASLRFLASFSFADDKTLKEAEQDGTRQPATRPESKSEGGDKAQPE